MYQLIDKYKNNFIRATNNDCFTKYEFCFNKKEVFVFERNNLYSLVVLDENLVLKENIRDLSINLVNDILGEL